MCKYDKKYVEKDKKCIEIFDIFLIIFSIQYALSLITINLIPI